MNNICSICRLPIIIPLILTDPPQPSCRCLNGTASDIDFTNVFWWMTPPDEGKIIKYDCWWEHNYKIKDDEVESYDGYK